MGWRTPVLCRLPCSRLRDEGDIGTLVGLPQSIAGKMRVKRTGRGIGGKHLDGGTLMKHYPFFLVAVATMAGLVALIAPAPGHASGESAPAFVTEIPHGYRDWRWISSAHEAGNLNSIGAVLGNDVAIKAYRDGKLPFPDGTIIAALHYRHVPSDENNKVFGQAQSFVPGAPTNIQFMVKDSKKYAATGGWGFGHFADGKHGDAAFMKSCFPCHEKAKATDLVFTHYAP
jgi:Cytochrome P460